MTARAALLALALSVAAMPLEAPAQQIIPGAEDLFSGEDNGDIMQRDWEQGVLIPLDQGADITTEENERVEQANAAVLRGLDKLSGEVTDLELASGETVALGRLEVTLGECRYPVANPSGNAYAYLVIRDANAQETRFAGWMVAASPALNGLEHPRYDVWVMRCRS